MNNQTSTVLKGSSTIKHIQKNQKVDGLRISVHLVPKSGQTSWGATSNGVKRVDLDKVYVSATLKDSSDGTETLCINRVPLSVLMIASTNGNINYNAVRYADVFTTHSDDEAVIEGTLWLGTLNLDGTRSLTWEFDTTDTGWLPNTNNGTTWCDRPNSYILIEDLPALPSAIEKGVPMIEVRKPSRGETNFRYSPDYAVTRIDLIKNELDGRPTDPDFNRFVTQLQVRAKDFFRQLNATQCVSEFINQFKSEAETYQKINHISVFNAGYDSVHGVNFSLSFTDESVHANAAPIFIYIRTVMLRANDFIKAAVQQNEMLTEKVADAVKSTTKQ
jgi:hypothetical protein